MAKIVIKKRVDLDFIEGYSGYIVFKGITVKEYEDSYLKEATKLKDVESETGSIKLIVNTLKSHFLEGKITSDGKEEDLTAEDIEDLDIGTVITVFERFTGGTRDPKSPAA